jgi:hypothetical protein
MGGSTPPRVQQGCMLNGIFNKGEGIMFAVRVKPYKAAELINEGCAEGEIWVKDMDSSFYCSEAERGVWPTQEEAWKHATEPWEYVVAVSLSESKGAHEELRRLKELLPDNLFESKDYNASGIVGRVEYLLAMFEASKEEIANLEERVAEAHLGDEW